MAVENFAPLSASGKYSIGSNNYAFDATVFSASSGGGGMTMVPSNVVLAEYDTQLNGFLPTGKIIYHDANGDFGRLFTEPHLACRMTFESNNVSFSHMFVVNSIELVGTEDGAHRYSLELVSAFWYQLAAKVHWSNYGDKKPKDIIDIVREILTWAVGEDFVDARTFEKEKSGISIYYTTHENDNAITAVSYLFNRLYTEPRSFAVKNQLKTIVFDTNDGKYKLLNMGNDKTYLPVTNPPVMFDSGAGLPTNVISWFEGFNAGYPKRQLVSLTASRYTSDMPMYFTRSSWDMNIVRDKFVRKYVESDRLFDIFTDVNYIDGEKRPASYNLASKENEKLHELLHQNGYIINESAWNNSRRLYTDLLYRAMYGNAFGVQQEASADHQAGALITYVSKQKTVNNGSGTTDNKDADSALRGPWLITRAKHILVFKDSGTPEGVPLFLERISCVKYNTVNKDSK